MKSELNEFLNELERLFSYMDITKEQEWIIKLDKIKKYLKERKVL